MDLPPPDSYGAWGHMGVSLSPLKWSQNFWPHDLNWTVLEPGLGRLHSWSHPRWTLRPCHVSRGVMQAQICLTPGPFRPKESPLPWAWIYHRFKVQLTWTIAKGSNHPSQKLKMAKLEKCNHLAKVKRRQPAPGVWTRRVGVSSFAAGRAGRRGDLGSLTSFAKYPQPSSCS
jgi:hypothetical protein